MYPGSHKSGVLWPLVNGKAALHPYTEAQAVPVPMTVGQVLFFHGHVLHRSTANLWESGKRRRVLTSGYQSCESVCTWMGHVRSPDLPPRPAPSSRALLPLPLLPPKTEPQPEPQPEPCADAY